MSVDGDDLEVIDPPSDPTSDRTSFAAARRMPRRGPRRTVALIAALLLAAGSLAVTALARGTRSNTDRSNTARSKTAETIVLPTATVAAPSVPRSTDANPLIAVPDAEFIGQMGLISPGVGWALNGLALYRTVDDGAHWSDITPPGTYDPIAHIDALDFLDADHAWAAVSRNSQPLTIYRTVDGGRSWQPLIPDVCGSAPTSTGEPCGAPAAIDFIDRAHGWAVLSPSGVTGTLLATRDGGNRWKVVGDTPFAGTLHFVDPDDGWGVSSASDRALYRTNDGGKTWRVVTLPAGTAKASTPSTISAPQFFGRDDVVTAGLTVGPSEPPRITVYESRDGGSTWVTRASPPDVRADAAEVASYRFSAPTSSDWTLLVGPHLSVTHDAGHHWSTLTPTEGRLDEVDFASRSSAWLLALAHTCTTPPVESCTNELLLRTTDGGATWQPGSPKIGITAGRLP